MASHSLYRSLFPRPSSTATTTTTATTSQQMMKINKKLDFDSCSEEDVPRSSSPDHRGSDLRKKLIFDFSEEEDFELSDPPSSPVKSGLVRLGMSPIATHDPKETSLLELKDFNTSGIESSVTTTTTSDKFSPCRTRSGKIYTSVEKRREDAKKNSSTKTSASKSSTTPASSGTTSSASKIPTPVFNDNNRSSSRHNSGASVGITTPRSTRIQTSHLRVQEVQLNLFQRDLLANNDMMDLDDQPACNEPPPLNYSKRPMSRLLHVSVDNRPVATPKHFENQSTPGSPWLQQTPVNMHSPPTNEVKAMKLFDKSPTLGSSPVRAFSAPKFAAAKGRLLFGSGDNASHVVPKRMSAPAAGFRVSFGATETVDLGKERKRKRVANINPFTPTSMLASLKKKYRSEPEMHLLCNSYVAHNENVAEDEFHRCSFNASAHNDDVEDGVNPAKRLRVSDIDISRYEEEFVEIKEIAAGSFGKVKVARHCLDGMVYAIKVTRNKIYGNTHEERVAMNEVFAHSALMKHKHVVRYYNSWVENGHVYIQNEYCEGGSLANLIKDYRRMGGRLPEGELKKIMLHIAKGLQYIHSKQLVHLDIKPENIFISLDHLTPSPHSPESKPSQEENKVIVSTTNPSNVAVAAEGTSNSTKNVDSTKVRSVVARGDISGNESTDSGHASGCDARFFVENSSASNTDGGVDGRISYKIGDLGHVAPIYGDHIPEEGDCRYMAPELLADDVDREKLPKADIFSLGLTLYEAASLQELPKNSLEDPMYERIKSGDLPFIEGYSKEFNQMLKSMVCQDENMRPTAAKIVSHPFLRSSSKIKSRYQLCQELRESQARIRQLELQLSTRAEQSETPASWLARFLPAEKSNRSSSPHTSPVSRQTPSAAAILPQSGKSTKRLLVGRGTAKSNSCLL